MLSISKRPQGTALTAKSGIKVIDLTGEDSESLGKGEMSALALLKKEKADAIISDDRKFISILEEEDAPLLVPSDAIVWLFRTGRVNKQEAVAAIEKLRSTVRKEAYNRAMKLIGGEIK